MEKIEEVFEFYNAGAEKGRLERGLGKVELYRTKEILQKYITDTNNIIYDIGGGRRRNYGNESTLYGYIKEIRIIFNFTRLTMFLTGVIIKKLSYV
jgi:hypothetical protein